VYGAFPTDPYSPHAGRTGSETAGHDRSGKGRDHHPLGRTRPRRIERKLSIEPKILRKSEFFADGHLSFTWCGTPFTYRLAKDGEKPSITVKATEGTNPPTTTREGGALTAEESRYLFARNGKIASISAVVAID
jgi:hypothetical protein